MSYTISLSTIEKEKLRLIIKDNQHKKNILKRVYCILLKNEGQKNANIIQLLNINVDTIADWSKIYLEKGIDGLINYKYSERRKSKLNPYRSKIKRIAGSKKINTIEQLQKKIKEEFSIEIEYSWLYRYCKKYGIYSILKGK